MLTQNIRFKNFIVSSNISKVKNDFKKLVNSNNEILNSLSLQYVYSYSKKIIKKYKKFSKLRIIGIGGSILGTEAIYSFLKDKIKKNFFFVNNLKNEIIKNKRSKFLNLIVSKSGNTLETISNFNVFVNKNDKNIFITENRSSYLNNLAQSLKSEIIHHNNFIGGRYSVLSEVGMLPAELGGLNPKKFKQFNFLVNNKNFVDSLVNNVARTISLIKKKNYASIILNYDEKSENLFKWYQQLSAESLGKKSKGIFPIISSMPKDNHSLLQLYLDGPKDNFFTFFNVKDEQSKRLEIKHLFNEFSILKKKNIYEIINSQKRATEFIFNKKKIPFRSFEILNRSEETLGELFCFFILETILLGRALNVNPFDQPSVELVKSETKKILL